MAARYDEAHALCLLVCAGAEVDMLSATSTTPLRVACASGSAVAAETLVRLGADLYNGVGTQSHTYGLPTPFPALRHRHPFFITLQNATGGS